MKEPTFKERFQYWFDKQMDKGSLSLIKLLTVCTLGIILMVSALTVLLGYASDGEIISDLWDNLATIINAWLPYYEDGDGSLGYLILKTIAAISGLLVTSVLIGIVASAIEEKITSLKHGNSRVIENDHTVVLGFEPGEYTLLKQLILAAGDKPRCIVVASETEREEMEEAISSNLEIPKNIRIICRTVDIFDPVSLEKCSLSTSRTVIISPTDNQKTVKLLLAVSVIINNTENEKVRVGATVSKDEFRFPESVARKHHLTTLQTYDVIAKIIAHSCTQPGLSDTFREVFNFEGSELYLTLIPEAVGKSFLQLSCYMDKAVPVGIMHEGHIYMNPDNDMVVDEEDQILIFAPERDAAVLEAVSELDPLNRKNSEKQGSLPAGKVVLLGYNESFDTVLRELPENVTSLVVSGCKKRFKDDIMQAAAQRPDMKVEFYDRSISDDEHMLRLVRDAKHIVLLSDHESDEEDADMQIIFWILNLRDLRDRYDLSYNITAEMRRESNQNLIEADDHIDFVVSSNMSSLFLAQLAECPELYMAFDELLSNEGSEFYLKNAAEMGCTGTRSVLELRRIALEQDYIMIGYIDSETGKSSFNPGLHDVLMLKPEDRIIVIGES